MRIALGLSSILGMAIAGCLIWLLLIEAGNIDRRSSFWVARVAGLVVPDPYSPDGRDLFAHRRPDAAAAMTAGLPTRRTTLAASYVVVMVWCKSCRHRRGRHAEDDRRGRGRRAAHPAPVPLFELPQQPDRLRVHREDGHRGTALVAPRKSRRARFRREKATPSWPRFHGGPAEAGGGGPVSLTRLPVPLHEVRHLTFPLHTVRRLFPCCPQCARWSLLD